MPEFHKKEEAEKLVSDVKEDGKPEEKDAKSDETDSFIKNKQRDINITDEVEVDVKSAFHKENILKIGN